MRNDGKSGRWVAIASTLLSLAAMPLSVSGQNASYLDFDGLTRELRSITGGSNLASLRSLGTSHQGRDIWVVTIADPSGPPVAQRPGILVVGNLSGDHLVGSQLALEAVRYLVGAGASEADLAQHVIYVVPRLNPDGAEAMFASPRTGAGGNALAFDDDNDGRLDEDGPNDLNGDGVITVMRVADPMGPYMVDPDEPRLMKHADAAAGETGTHSIYWEGLDDDGDGFINEDASGGVDLDRSFQHDYPYWERDAGPNMVSEPEARALMDFVVASGNIAAVVTFGHSDNLVTPPNGRGELADGIGIDLNTFATASNGDLWDVGVYGVPRQQGGLRLRGAQPGSDNDPNSGRRPSMTVHAADQEYYKAVSDAYRDITGITEIALNREAHGAFFQFAYFQFGVPAFSTPGWALPSGDEEDDSPAAKGDARLLAAFERAGRDAFVPWATAQHADLGAVEIGGFRPDIIMNPPASELADLGMKHGQFVARLSGMLARVRIVNTEVEAHGGGVFTVSADVVNTGRFPSAIQHGVVARAVDPVTVQIQIDPESILTGAAKTHQITSLDGSGTRGRVTWVIKGDPGSTIEIRLRAQKGGSDSVTVTLR
ncbi:MAG: M14 family metallopeptidase [Gemmatimonadetes bacterium]|nr:M14 family metallopeptidase [Gemmatimonadota bacterium]